MSDEGGYGGMELGKPGQFIGRVPVMTGWHQSPAGDVVPVQDTPATVSGKAESCLSTTTACVERARLMFQSLTGGSDISTKEPGAEASPAGSLALLDVLQRELTRLEGLLTEIQSRR